MLLCLQAVGAFALSLPLAALELAVLGVTTAAASRDSKHQQERGDRLDDEEDAALSLAETLLGVGDARALAQHAEFDARRLPRWARLLDGIAALVVRSVPASSGAEGAARVTPGRLARAKRVLASAGALLASLPALRSARNVDDQGASPLTVGGDAAAVAALI